jgi:hypothetical protein
MIAALTKHLPGFKGKWGHVQCIAHRMNLVVKVHTCPSLAKSWLTNGSLPSQTILSPFVAKKKNGKLIDKALIALLNKSKTRRTKKMWLLLKKSTLTVRVTWLLIYQLRKS